MVKTEPRKATYKEAAAQQQHPDFTGAPFPPSFELDIGKSPGNPVVELVPPNGTNNRTEGTNKNELRV